MTDDSAPTIVITNRPVDAATLKRLAEHWFGDMVKLVVSDLVGRGEPL
ncbi:MAG: hypothetical protein IMZ44_21995 [Planctomycetes bacterium]|nr:hypothetical protein [Planctomycetota bacterium]